MGIITTANLGERFNQITAELTAMLEGEGGDATALLAERTALRNVAEAFGYDIEDLAEAAARFTERAATHEIVVREMRIV